MDLLETLKANYPKRDGAQGWGSVPRLVEKALSGGADESRMVLGTHNYGKHCFRKGMVGTEFVMQAKTFYGRDQHWEEWADMDMRSPSEVKEDARWDDLKKRADAVGVSVSRGTGLDRVEQMVIAAERDAMNAQWERNGLNLPKFTVVK